MGDRREISTTDRGRRLQPGTHGFGRGDLRSQESALFDLPGNETLQSARKWKAERTPCETSKEGSAALHPRRGSDCQERQSLVGATSIEGTAWWDVGVSQWARGR